ncbi:hypothetical protein PY650_32815 [Rhizobium calliandrae]|uniref:Uncharacterized protein n=1 Tax=Rhizobium calliandrae TaxID=1312182 RepID=A0ABT7KS76_9HYPH|nr:DUF6656 family protein [Rhizobium calliandrae]MDL2410299.1 hypothetical protein [Rhizobium calliandrae]
MAKLRYFDTKKTVEPEPTLPPAGHSEFLRTGRISRDRTHWLAEERRYLTHAEVAERTATRLRNAGEKTHDRLNSFHQSIRFPKLIFHHTLKDTPHLGYCHVTAARTQFAQYEEVSWAFYIANFFARIGQNDNFFEDINLKYSRMYFAVAVQPDQESPEKLTINREIRGNGVLFHTHDPQIAIRNVLLLGARNEQLRDIIRQL